MLEDQLAPNEVIVFRQGYPGLEVRGEQFDELVLTSKRIIFYKRTGLIFKKDHHSSVGLSNVVGVKAHEKGVIRKKGILEIYLKDSSTIPIEGNPSEIKYLYQNLLSKLE